MGESTHKTNIIPLPKDKEFTAIIGEDNQVKAYLTKPKRNNLGGNWVAVFLDALAWLAEQALPNEQYRVLMYLMSKLDFDNYIRVTQSSLGEALNIKQGNVSRAMKGLLERKIIIEGPRAGTAKTYRLNPHMAHRGAKNFRSNVYEWDSLMKQKTESEKS